MTSDDLKTEHRISTMEAELRYMSQTLGEVKSELSQHIQDSRQLLQSVNDLRVDVVERVDAVEDTASTNRTYLRVIAWVLGFAGIGGGAAGGLLKLF